MKNIAGIILAAGEGTRMKSQVPKVLHKIGTKPMLLYMLELLEQAGIKKFVVVIGHRHEQVKELFKKKDKIKTVRQTRLLGSADAVKQTRKIFSKYTGDLLIVYGDTPLVTFRSLQKLIQRHQESGASCTLLTANFKNPTGFGRILRDENNHIVKIVEEQDADTYEKAIGEINVGVYCFKKSDLFVALEQITPNNVKKEYYLTDAVAVLNRQRKKIESVSTENEQEAIGVNSRQTLALANKIINNRNIERLNSNGVTIVDPATTYICAEVEIGYDTVIFPHTIIEDRVKIGNSCRIGPFARVRSGSVLKDNVEIGNFVEIVRSQVGSHSKIKHHSYIGDATIGEGVNVGAGTITANYDGKNKNRTLIENGAFIGVGSILIAPVKIGRKAVTGAGSVVTRNRDVPAGKTVVGVPAKILKKSRR